MEIKNLQEKIDKYSNENDTDIFLYAGPIFRGPDDTIINLCRKRKLRKNILLILATYGGSADAAYRISRCFQKAYKTNSPQSTSKYTVLIDGMCKSAGTLICLGADELIMSGNAELGPLDVQLAKKDEIGERESGLTPIQALQFLKSQSLVLFRHCFNNLRFDPYMNFSTKTALTSALELTKGLLSPIYDQLDPIRLAEVDRHMQVALNYGERLKTTNLKEDTITNLLTNYPSHGFVIDRTESTALFEKVINLDGELKDIANELKILCENSISNSSNPCIKFLSSEKELTNNE